MSCTETVNIHGEVLLGSGAPESAPGSNWARNVAMGISSPSGEDEYPQEDPAEGDHGDHGARQALFLLKS